jgi:hypothetical protein
MSDGTVIRDAVTSMNTIAGTSARLIAVMIILDGCTDREDQHEARRAARQDGDAGLRALLSEAARLAELQPEIGRALTSDNTPDRDRSR